MVKNPKKAKRTPFNPVTEICPVFILVELQLGQNISSPSSPVNGVSEISIKISITCGTSFCNTFNFTPPTAPSEKCV